MKRARVDLPTEDEPEDGTNTDDGLRREQFSLNIFRNEVQRMVIRNRQVININQFKQGSQTQTNTVGLLFNNNYDFYLHNSVGRLMYKARPLFRTNNLHINDQVALGVEPFQYMFVNPVEAKTRLSHPVSFSFAPGTTQPERVAGNDTPYFFVGMENTGALRTFNVIGGPTVANFRRSKTIPFLSSEFGNSNNNGTPDQLPVVIGVGKDQKFETRYKWNNPRPFNYRNPDCNIVLSGNSYIYHTNVSYLPQQLGASTANDTNHVTCQYHLTDQVFGGAGDRGFANNPMLAGNSINPIFLWVPELDTNPTLEINFKVILETELVVDCILPFENINANYLGFADTLNPIQPNTTPERRVRNFGAQQSIGLDNCDLAGTVPTNTADDTRQFGVVQYSGLSNH